MGRDTGFILDSDGRGGGVFDGRPACEGATDDSAAAVASAHSSPTSAQSSSASTHFSPTFAHSSFASTHSSLTFAHSSSSSSSSSTAASAASTAPSPASAAVAPSPTSTLSSSRLNERPAIRLRCAIFANNDFATLSCVKFNFKFFLKSISAPRSPSSRTRAAPSVKNQDPHLRMDINALQNF